MKCLVVSPEKTVLEIEATFVALPLIDGEYGIMAGHSPVVARIGAGELRITGVDGQTTRYFVEGGFAEVLDDVVALLTMAAIPEEELSVERAEKQLQDALERPSNTPELAKLKAERVNSRRARLHMAKKVAAELEAFR